MDENFSDVVQTSSNLGVIKQNQCPPTSFDIQILVRSQIEDEKQSRADKFIQHFHRYGASCRKEGDYPGWKPNPDSTIYKIMAEQYRKLFNKEPQTMVIHAGLECGLFSDKYPHWDMISFGPTIKFPHSPDEKVNIESVDKYWLLLIATLKAID
jgi:dipeptidase D